MFRDKNSKLQTPFLKSKLFYILVSCASVICAIILIGIIYCIAMCTCLKPKVDNKVISLSVEMVEQMPPKRPELNREVSPMQKENVTMTVLSED